MKLIINTVNIKVGGALQRAISFIKDLKEIKNNNEYFIFYNKAFRKEVLIEDYPENFKFYYFEHSPAPLKTRRKVVSEFNLLEDKIKPDIVFSFVGPCYWRPKSIHLVGYAVPHIVYNDYKYVKALPFKSKLEMFYKKYWTKKEADYYVVQTNDVKKRLSSVLNFSENNIFLVSNGIGNQYKNIQVNKTNNRRVKKLLMISAFRPSKNFEIINEVIPYLELDEKFTYEFHITINSEDYEKVFANSRKSVINHGHTFAKDCPDLYNECDAMFLPTHLECFSASYPEAMKMEKPILTSGFSFAKTVCNKAAVYFDNTNPKDISEKIISVFHNDDLYNSLIIEGKKRLREFDNSMKQAKKYLRICEEIKNK